MFPILFRCLRADLFATIFLCISLLNSTPVLSQQVIIEPEACPTRLYSFFVSKASTKGKIFYFVNTWVRNSPAGTTSSFYDHFLHLNPIMSDDGRAAWYDPGLRIECTKEVWYRANGTIESSTPNYRIKYTEGEVIELPCNGEEDWNPEDPYGYDSGPSGGDPSVSGCSAPPPPAPAGPECQLEWVIVEISFDGGFTWAELWQGWATIC